MNTTAMAVDSLCRELEIGWGEADQRELEQELSPYTYALFEHLDSGVEIPSHIAGAGSVCVPITRVTHPRELFEVAEGTVKEEPYIAEEYENYWITVHHSTVPVVILLLKEVHQPLARLTDLFHRCSLDLGYRVGGNNGAYFQWNQPGFGWQLHTDDEYEGVCSRVHIPFITTPNNIFSWAEGLDTPEEDWLLTVHLEHGRVYETRTDVPHTAINRDPDKGRLHLILDVTSEPYEA